jgi:drug/metabolite transporter (DMT)-like permease
MDNAIYAMIFGVIGTALYHIGKSMQKQGIDFLHDIRNKVRNPSRTKASNPALAKSGALYVTGVVLNNTLAVWIMLAGMFAPPSYFSSMFGLGLIALVLYSRHYLKETITRMKQIGILLLVLGTVTLGIEGILRKRVSMSDIDLEAVILFIAIYVSASLVFMFASSKSKDPFFIGVSFGFFTGGIASLDPVLKGIAQHYGGTSGFLPSTHEGWLIFGASFLLTTISFVGVQVGFMKDAPASVQVSISSSVYVCMPLIVQDMALPGFRVTPATAFGMIMVVGGILCIVGFGDTRARSIA